MCRCRERPVLVMILVVRSFIFNILGRVVLPGVLLPRCGCLATGPGGNGVLFALKHASLGWVIPDPAVSLGLAFYAGRWDLPLAVLVHWLGNDLELIPPCSSCMGGG